MATSTAKVVDHPTRSKQKSIGALIDEMQKLRAKKQSLEAEAKDVEAAYKVIEAELKTRMEAEGVTKSSGKLATASLKTSTVPNVKDWDAFYNYIHKTKYFHLLQRRASSSGCMELLESKGAIPGVETFTETKVGLTTLK